VPPKAVVELAEMDEQPHAWEYPVQVPLSKHQTRRAGKNGLRVRRRGKGYRKLGARCAIKATFILPVVRTPFASGEDPRL